MELNAVGKASSQSRSCIRLSSIAPRRDAMRLLSSRDFLHLPSSFLVFAFTTSHPLSGRPLSLQAKPLGTRSIFVSNSIRTLEVRTGRQNMKHQSELRSMSEACKHSLRGHAFELKSDATLLFLTSSFEFLGKVFSGPDCCANDKPG